MESALAAAEPVPLVELSDVAASANRAALEAPINWRIMPGDYWVIGGLHGSGRADLIATAAGVQPAVRGIVQLFGQDISAMKEETLLRSRLRIGIVFERGGRIFNHLSVAENVALPLRYHKDWTVDEAEPEVTALLNLTGLSPFAGHPAGSLSIGWQQRVALARALALQPELLFLDKPLSGLDLRHRQWWIEFLDGLAAGSELAGGRAITLVVTADDLPSWLDHGKQFAALKNNRWHVLGTRAELKSDKQNSLSDLWIEDMP